MAEPEYNACKCARCGFTSDSGGMFGKATFESWALIKWDDVSFVLCDKCIEEVKAFVRGR